MEKKQKTLSLLLAIALGTGCTAPAQATGNLLGKSQQLPSGLTEPTPTLDVRPILTQVPTVSQTGTPDGSQQTPAPTVAPEWCPPATPAATAIPTPVCMPEGTTVPTPTATAVPISTPAPTASSRPEATRKPVVATPAPSTDDDYTTGYVGMQEEIAFLLLNQDRAANGLAPLALDPALCAVARAKSMDMKTNRYFSHTSPTYGKVSQMLKAFGYTFSAAGENIAHHATVEKSQAAFMSSQGHRRNILSTGWTKVGIGVVTDAQGYVYVTQIFVR